MARILVAANSTWNIQNFRRGLIREFLRKGHHVVTVAPEPRGIKIDGVEVPHRSCPMQRSGINPFRDLASLFSLARVVREEQPDAFFSFTIKPNLYGSFICQLFKVPAVPNVSGLGTSFLGNAALRRTIMVMYRLAFARTRAVFFQNPDDRALFVDHGIVRPSHAVVLPGSGIDLSYFCPAELPTDLRFLMVGRLLRDKGVLEYVEAARTLKAKLPTARFSLLGELDHGNRTAVQERDLQQWVREGVIDYLGSTDDVRPFIREASAIVLPSYREGLPRTLLEAAAMGRPLIGTDVPGCREVVRDGITGFLCEARSVDSLIAAMERLAATSYEDRVRMAYRARKMAEREFDEQRVVGEYLGLVRQLFL